jgi:hypothetical protein
MMKFPLWDILIWVQVIIQENSVIKIGMNLIWPKELIIINLKV